MAQDSTYATPRDRLQSSRTLRKNRFGISLFCISQSIPYFLLINIRYMVAEQYVPSLVSTWLGAVPTAALLIGCIPLFAARNALAQSRIRQLRGQLAVSLLFLVTALVFMLVPLWLHAVNVLGRFGEVYIVSLGVTSFYTLVSLVVVAGVWLRTGKGLIDQEHSWSLEAATWVYGFNTVAWIVMYLILYFV